MNADSLTASTNGDVRSKLHGRVEPSERITLDRLAVDGTYHTIDNGVTRRWNGITDEYVDTLDARGEGE